MKLDAMKLDILDKNFKELYKDCSTKEEVEKIMKDLINMATIRAFKRVSEITFNKEVE